MEEIKYYCYICDEELTDTNNSDEHIILNAIGGHLHSNKLLCKRCNNTLGAGTSVWHTGGFKISY